MANRRFIDFPIASTVGDSDIILIWQSGANKQTTKATFLSGLPENLDELNDVAISGLTNGQILRYDSVTGKWENTDQGNLDLNDLNDVSIVSPSNGQVLVYNSSTSKWENSSGGYVPYTGAVTTVNLGAQTIQAGQFVKAGGTSSQFLKADGSVDSTAYGTGSVTSVALTMPSAFNVANSPITTAGTLAVTGAGNVGQYIRGDGSLADFPQASGGGSSVSYYLNGSISQGTIGGVAYKELNKVPILGAGTDFTINADGYIASFLTDAGDPNLLEIPGGNWNFETYFSASSSGGSPSFYVELYKYDGTTFTLIASSSSSPELIAFGTNLNPYFSTLAVPTTTLALTDRLAIRYYVTHSGRTITLHTENNHLCQVVTTFTTGLTSLNGLTAQVQNLAVGTSGTDFNIASATATHTFNLPTASATNRGALSSADWTTFNNKQNALGYVPVPETRTITINGVSQDLSANRTYNVGTVTSVGLSSATSGVTIGGSPVTGVGAFTLAIATATGSQNGLLSSTDWTTFNNKQNTLTNPVTGTGTSGQIAYFNGTSAITGESALTWDATNDRLNIGAGTANSNLTVSGSDNSIIFSVLAGVNSRLHVGTVSSGTITYIRSQNNYSLNLGVNNTDYLSISTTGNSSFSGNIILTTGANRFVRIGSSTAYYYDLQTTGDDFQIIEAGTTPRLTIKYPNGNVLIGTTTDAGYKLDVNGTGRFTNTLTPIILRSTNASTMWTEYYYNTSTLSGYVGSGSGLLSGANASDFIVRSEADFVVATGGNNRRLTITSSGNVGIGISIPTNPLHIQSNTLSQLNVTALSGNTNAQINLEPTGTGIALIGPANNVDFAFRTNAIERMRISNTGQVSINSQTSSNDNVFKFFIDSTLASIQATYNTTGSYVPIRLLTSDTERMRITPGGNVLIGKTTDDGTKFQVSGNATVSGSGNTLLVYSNNNSLSLGVGFQGVISGYIGGISSALYGYSTNGGYALLNSSSVWVAASDAKRKRNFEDYNLGLNAIVNLKPKLYNMDFQKDGDKKQVGLVAQEVKEFIPLAFEQNDNFIGLNYNAIIVTMVKAIQELNEKIK